MSFVFELTCFRLFKTFNVLKSDYIIYSHKSSVIFQDQKL